METLEGLFNAQFRDSWTTDEGQEQLNLDVYSDGTSWDDVLRQYPLHRNQYAYQTGKSTGTAFHNLATSTENANERKQVSLIQRGLSTEPPLL
jgi:hypothetical protein